MAGVWRTTSSYGGGSMDGLEQTKPRSGEEGVKDWLIHGCEKRGYVTACGGGGGALE